MNNDITDPERRIEKALLNGTFLMVVLGGAVGKVQEKFLAIIANTVDFAPIYVELFAFWIIAAIVWILIYAHWSSVRTGLYQLLVKKDEITDDSNSNSNN